MGYPIRNFKKMALALGLVRKLARIAVFLNLAPFVLHAQEGKMTTLYDFTMKDINGKETPLSEYQGKVVLVVNVASRCGFTPQYEGLEALYLKYKEKGFVVLGFPANNFLWQEPGTDAEIKTFCSTKYNVTFPMFSKISVKGKEQHPLYKWLTSKESNPKFGGAISWNFNKFLIGRDGSVIGRFGSRETPQSETIKTAVEAALNQ